MKPSLSPHRRYTLIAPIVIISVLSFFVTDLFCSELYDLCEHATALNEGKLLYLRHRNPTLDPVLRTYEIYIFDPFTKSISFVQKHEEKIYIPPVVSRDRSTISYHSLVEGNDYLVTTNRETGKSVRLRFDTGGYFVALGIDYDNDTIVAALKRGTDREALYRISNRGATIERVVNGTSFQEVGFLGNGNLYYTENINNKRVLGYVNVAAKKSITIAEGVEYVQKTPNGNTILYSLGSDLLLYRMYNNESIKLTPHFDIQTALPLLSRDGTACAIVEKDSISIVNIPSGDILYYLSMNTQDSRFFLTNYTFAISQANKLFHLKFKKPGQSLTELYRDEKEINLVSVSPNDRYVVYQKGNKNELFILDTKTSKRFAKEFPFIIQHVIQTEKDDSLYIIAISEKPSSKARIRELYLYSFQTESLFPISTAANTDIKAYLKKE